MGIKYDRIKAAAKEKGLTITEVEKSLGFARGSLSKIDNHVPSAEKAAAISEFLDIPLDELTTAKQKKVTAVFHKQTSLFAKQNEEFARKIVDTVLDTMLDDFQWELLDRYAKADPGTQAAIRKLLDIEDKTEERDISAS